MADERHEKLAKVLVNYSIGIKPGDKLLIRAGTAAAPLIREVYREAIRAGAHVSTRLNLEGLSEIFLKEASEEQLTFYPPILDYELGYFDADISINSTENTQEMNNIDSKKMTTYMAALASYSKARLERYFGAKLTRWVGTLFPTQGLAQEAHMSLSEYEDFVYAGGRIDTENPVAEWQKAHETQQHIVDYLNLHNQIRIVAQDTDITYRVGGRTWVNCDGKLNFPDGEVFTGPIEDSVNGTVHFTYPAQHSGKEAADVRLTFRNGRVVESGAGRGLDFLNAMLDLDAGARSLGEVAFGTNYNIKQFTGNTLFDEKIGGTMHMALGASIPGTGSNQSTLHWDMVCDLREGQVFADGQLCYEAGHFTI